MPGIDVARVSGSTAIVPRGLTSTPSAGSRKDRSGACPMASTTESQDSTDSVPSKNRGLNRPSGSNTEETCRVSSPSTPVDPRIRFGPNRWMISIPSPSASSISKAVAGISSRASRATTLTLKAPIRTAVRATSNARVAADLGLGPAGGNLPDGGPGDVQRHVPSTDHQHIVPQLHPVAEVRVQQEVHGSQDAVELDAGDLEIAAPHGPSRHEDR